MEKEAFREFLKERSRVRDVAQVALVSHDRTTKAPAGNKGGVVEGGVVEGGVNGGLVDIGGTKPTPEN